MSISTRIEAATTHVEGAIAHRRHSLHSELGQCQPAVWRHAKLVDTFTQPFKTHAYNGAVVGGRIGRLTDLVAGGGSGAPTQVGGHYRPDGIVPPATAGQVAHAQGVAAHVGGAVGNGLGIATCLLAVPYNAAYKTELTFASWIDAADARGTRWASGLLGTAIGALGRGTKVGASGTALATQAVGALVGGVLWGALVGTLHAGAASAVWLLTRAGGVLRRQADVVGQQASEASRVVGRHAQATGEAIDGHAKSAAHRGRIAAEGLMDRAKRDLGQLEKYGESVLHRGAANADAAGAEAAAATKEAAEEVAGASERAEGGARRAAAKHAARG